MSASDTCLNRSDNPWREKSLFERAGISGLPTYDGHHDDEPEKRRTVSLRPTMTNTGVKEVYEKRAKWYDGLITLLGYSAARKVILRKLPLETPSKILDLGCGTGLATGVLLKRFPNARITGLDLSEEMLKLYKVNFPTVQVLLGDFNKENVFHTFPSQKPVKIGAFDLIISTGAVSEYGDLNKAIPLTYKLLKKGGVFVNIGVENNILGRLIAKVWYFTPTSREKFITSCKNAGFSDVQLLPFPWYLFTSKMMNYIIKARK